MILRPREQDSLVMYTVALYLPGETYKIVFSAVYDSEQAFDFV
jgi:hypothetical protein